MNKNKLVFANWKMNLNSNKVRLLVEGILSKLKPQDSVDVVLSPPLPYLGNVNAMILGSGIELSSQNVFWEDDGPYTGEVSVKMLLDMGCSWAMIGHSERRMNYKEGNSLLTKKLLAAASEDLKIIFCIGESLQEKESGKTYYSLKKQLEVISKVENAKLIIAYEPVWAIGSNNPAEPEYIEEVHNGISEELKSLEINEPLGIMYGGSVKMDSAKQILSLNNVDGLLIGGASLNEAEFSNIALSSSA